MIRKATVLIFVAVLVGCGGSGGNAAGSASSAPGSENGAKTLGNSNVSFREALSACPDALGSVSFAAGHGRVTAHAGVDTDETLPDANGIISVVLENASGTKTAQVRVDQTKRSVSAKNMRMESRGNVACIYPD